MCDCFHLAFPNWHAASSGTGGHHSLSLSFLCCFTDSAAGLSRAVGEIRFCACVCDGGSECEAAGADAELYDWPAVSAGCVCRVQRSVWRCHHGKTPDSSALLPVSLLLRVWCRAWKANRLSYWGGGKLPEARDEKRLLNVETKLFPKTTACIKCQEFLPVALHLFNCSYLKVQNPPDTVHIPACLQPDYWGIQWWFRLND